ncbi:MAG: DUF4136 domain-containing protein [Ramlibacter sp.]
MKNKLRVAAASVLATLVFTGCGSTPQVGSDADHGANFSGYHSFALVRRDRLAVLRPGDPMQNPLVVSRIEEEIKQDLLHKGYTLETDPAHADLVVDFTIGTHERLDIQSFPGGWGGGPPLAGPRWGNDLDVHQAHEGALAIDIYDVQARRPVWHGWAQKDLTRKDIEQSSAPIHEAVASVLAKFPPPEPRRVPEGSQPRS